MATTVINLIKFGGNSVFCRRCHVLYNHQYGPKLTFVRRSGNAETKTGGEADPAPLFFNPDVQKLLRQLTRVDLKKVFHQRKDGRRLEPPEYKFMTTHEVNEALKEAEARAEQMVQMPPVIMKRKVITNILSRDPEIKGYDQVKFVFTDITYGVSDMERLAVVRDEEGTLRNASWEERQRVNQAYFPQIGRKMPAPKMFEEEYLKSLLEREEYRFVLDRACVQYEPDDPEYHRITTTTYDHINRERHYETLRSTRHFGPLAFHLAWNNAIDNLLLENIQTKRLDDAVLLVRLFHIINPQAKSAAIKHVGDDLKLIQAYVESDSHKKSMLELALQTYQELQQGIQKVHGHRV